MAFPSQRRRRSLGTDFDSDYSATRHSGLPLLSANRRRKRFVVRPNNMKSNTKLYPNFPPIDKTVIMRGNKCESLDQMAHFRKTLLLSSNKVSRSVHGTERDRGQYRPTCDLRNHVTDVSMYAMTPAPPLMSEFKEYENGYAVLPAGGALIHGYRPKYCYCYRCKIMYDMYRRRDPGLSFWGCYPCHRW